MDAYLIGNAPREGFLVNHMLETALTAFTTFFAVIGPIDSAVLVASLTPNATKAERRAISLKAVAIATLIVLAFALFGQPLLNQLGVSLPALQVAGGIILLIIALDMTLSKRPSPARLTLKESEEAESKAEAHAEITVFPLATPLLAGPGAMTSAIVLAAGTKGDPKLLVAVVLAILAVMLVTLVFLLLAQEVHALIGLTARKVIVRVFGVLLAAIAVQSIFNGITASHIFS
ncbi:MAG: MarC family protein [Methyloceanibacter sp.]